MAPACSPSRSIPRLPSIAPRAASLPMRTGANISTLHRRVAVGSSATAIRTTPADHRAARQSYLCSFTTETRANFLQLVGGLLPEGITHVQLFSVGRRRWRQAASPNPSPRVRDSSASGAAITARQPASSACSVGGYRNHQGPFPPGMHMSPYASCYRCPWNPGVPVLRSRLR
jgi:hypothetical protein